MGILFIGEDVTEESELHGKLLSGNSYLINDENIRSSLDLFKGLIRSRNNGLLITRDNPINIESIFPLKNIDLVELTQEKSKDFESIYDLGKLVEKIIGWYRSGRIDDNRALKLAENVWRCLYHIPLSFLPAGIHRFLTDWHFAKAKIVYLTVRPIRLYFNAELREQWLHEMVMEGKNKNLLTDEDSDVILSQIKEPFIQKYLKSLAAYRREQPGF